VQMGDQFFSKYPLQFERIGAKLMRRNENGLCSHQFMRKTISFLTLLVLAATMATGCANSNKKLGRGFSNLMEPVRLGEMRRSIEQTAVWGGAGAGYSGGFMMGLQRTLVRTGLGVYEVATFPLPTPGHGYGPLLTSSYSPGPVYPDSYTPGMVSDTMFSTDTSVGFSGGDVMPIIPGSRFRIFDTH
jgi:putative exosortase-associated protein (TIGR04073 family)